MHGAAPRPPNGQHAGAMRPHRRMIHGRFRACCGAGFRRSWRTSRRYALCYARRCGPWHGRHIARTLTAPASVSSVLCHARVHASPHRPYGPLTHASSSRWQPRACSRVRLPHPSAVCRSDVLCRTHPTAAPQARQEMTCSTGRPPSVSAQHDGHAWACCRRAWVCPVSGTSAGMCMHAPVRRA